MFEVRRFTRAFYLVLALALFGYAIALEAPLAFLATCAFLPTHAWFSRPKPLFVLPKFLAGVAALVSGVWCVMGLVNGLMTPLMAVSQWLFVLLLVTLWGPSNNRTSGQMLVMSLILMVAGAINTASVIFGVILVIYLLAAVYCCLLFHLKVATEEAHRTYAIDPDHINPQAVRHDEVFFHRSIRRLAAVITTFSVIVAIAVFMFFPRARTAGLMMQMQLPGGGSPSSPAVAATGFSEQMSLNQVAKISQNASVVAHVSITRNGKPARLPELYLRGATLGVYTGRMRAAEQLSWQWISNHSQSGGTRAVHVEPSEQTTIVAEPTDKAELIEQTIYLQPLGSPVLFVVGSPESFQSEKSLDLEYSETEGTLRVQPAPRTPIRYTVRSSTALPTYHAPPPEPMPGPPEGMYLPPAWAMPPEMPTESQIDPVVAAFARRPEVSGRDQGRPLFELRGSHKTPHALDETIARNIESYLQRNYLYTLDLTAVKRRPDTDPIAGFLTDFKKGHCEYFAGSMALLCQSLGLEARVVMGFHVPQESYNALGDYYVVKQSDAHAWVEVLTPDGWRTFDPTTADLATPPIPKPDIRRKLSDMLDYVQYKWATSVVTYGNEDRIGMLDDLDFGITHLVSILKDSIARLKGYLRSENGYVYIVSSGLLLAGLALSLTCLLVAIILFIVEKIRLIRRAERIGIHSLPHGDQLRLARQLKFYDDLLRLLERKQISRPGNLTPMEFAQSLTFLPAECYEEVCRLTGIFYRIRFGNYRLTPKQRRHLAITVGHLARVLTLRSRQGIVVRDYESSDSIHR